MRTIQTRVGWKPAILFSFAALLCTGRSMAQYQDYEYTNVNGAIKLTRYTGPGGDVTIPSSLDGDMRGVENNAGTMETAASTAAAVGPSKTMAQTDRG